MIIKLAISLTKVVAELGREHCSPGTNQSVELLELTCLVAAVQVSDENVDSQCLKTLHLAKFYTTENIYINFNSRHQ